MAVEQALNQPKAWNILARLALFNILRAPIAPAEVMIIGNSAEKANKLLKDGYSLWVLGTHFSKREGFELTARPAQYIHEIMRLPLVMPISYHQYSDNEPLINLLNRIAAVTVSPVVNQDTVDKRRNFDRKTGKKLPLGHGIFEYAARIKDTFAKGGVAGIAPQAGRRKELHLSQAKTKPLEFLITKNKINRGDKLAFLFMPIKPGDKVNYDQIYESYNLGMNYLIKLGPTLTLEEMYRHLDEINEHLSQLPVEDNKFKITLDELALIILSVGTDPDYNKINPDYLPLLEKYIGVMEAVTQMI